MGTRKLLKDVPLSSTTENISHEESGLIGIGGRGSIGSPVKSLGSCGNGESWA